MVCDGTVDCSDRSDEKRSCCAKRSDMNSGLWASCTFDECEARGRFKCEGEESHGSNGKCLSRDMVFDGKNDCGNACDEWNGYRVVLEKFLENGQKRRGWSKNELKRAF